MKRNAVFCRVDYLFYFIFYFFLLIFLLPKCFPERLAPSSSELPGTHEVCDGCIGLLIHAFCGFALARTCKRTRTHLIIENRCVPRCKYSVHFFYFFTIIFYFFLAHLLARFIRIFIYFLIIFICVIAIVLLLLCLRKIVWLLFPL